MLDIPLQTCVTSTEQRGRLTSLDLLEALCPGCHRLLCWLTVSLVSNRTHRAISSKPLSTWVVHSIFWCLELFVPRVSIWHFPLLNFTWFLSTSLSSQLTSRQTKKNQINKNQQISLERDLITASCVCSRQPHKDGLT